ncbi:hypothetical protein CSAL01_04830 [Colletotrichum salicis]|uniref:Uncharacterized protein n=1 Tax=Colletotrichum salicis TaxID=1209931 RepID=A0A135UD48_9PEZI|nr:hypothetical protein CSAL01_04830 [Colletotrichum salicis]
MSNRESAGRWSGRRVVDGVGGSAPMTTCLGWGSGKRKRLDVLYGVTVPAQNGQATGTRWSGSFSSTRWDVQCTVPMATILKNGASVFDIRRASADFSALACRGERLNSRFTPVSSQQRLSIGIIRFALPRDHRRPPTRLFNWAAFTDTPHRATKDQGELAPGQLLIFGIR